MALIPFADHLLIPAGSNDPRITARAGILHVDAGNAESLYHYFNGPSGGIESHGFIKKSGVVEQYRDTAYQADANLNANDFALSFETQGFGAGEWTDEQIESIKRVMLWAKDAHGIPLRKIQNWNGSGWGYHTQFGAPGPWTPVSKTCPGPDRIQQFNDVLVPWMNTGGVVEEQREHKPTVNITNVLEAPDHDARIRALRQVIKFGSSESQQIASEWLDAMKRMDKVRTRIHNLRADLEEHEVKA